MKRNVVGIVLGFAFVTFASSAFAFGPYDDDPYGPRRPYHHGPRDRYDERYDDRRYDDADSSDDSADNTAVLKFFGLAPLPAVEPFTDVMNGKPVDTADIFLRQTKGKDRLLYALERGRIAQLAGDAATSKESFELAISIFRQQEEQAMLSATGAGRQALSIIINDKAVEYRGLGFERVMAHVFQAENYLAAGDLDGAAVEMRNVNAAQDEALREHEQEIDDAKKAADEKKVNVDLASGDAGTVFSQMDAAASKVKNSFQNGYASYFSGLVSELMREPGDAYIEYKKVLGFAPENPYVQADVMRLAKALGMREDLAALQKKYPAVAGVKPRAADQGTLVVLFEEGSVPQKEGALIPLPMGSGLIAVAFPFYRGPWVAPQTMTVTVDSLQPQVTAPIADMGAIVIKALKERIAAMAVKQIIRSSAKGVAVYQAKKQLGILGEIAGSIYNVLSEQPDTRCWISLPRHAQIVRMNVPSGDHAVTLTYGSSSAVARYRVMPGGVTVIRVAIAGDHVLVKRLWGKEPTEEK